MRHDGRPSGLGGGGCMRREDGSPEARERCQTVKQAVWVGIYIYIYLKAAFNNKTMKASFSLN